MTCTRWLPVIEDDNEEDDEDHDDADDDVLFWWPGWRRITRICLANLITSIKYKR
jgi:hypothetical protein